MSTILTYLVLIAGVLGMVAVMLAFGNLGLYKRLAKFLMTKIRGQTKKQDTTATKIVPATAVNRPAIGTKGH